VLYADERGVTRIYQMSLEGGVWQMWRDSPGFSQRVIGTISEDGNTIACHGKLSRDGSRWVQDLDVTYTRKR
jgi:Tol biopolymer transport system component